MRIVESWAAPGGGGGARLVHVYSSAPNVQLFLNGAAATPVLRVPDWRASVEANVTYAAGTIEARALAADGATVLATHSTSSWGAPASLTLTVDVPSAATGTGTRVYLDGADVALLRATVLDAQGNVVRDSTLNISFAVTAGPGFVAGVGNGDPACHEPSHAPWRSAYHGLARVIVRASLDAAGSAADRALEAQVNVEAGQGAGARSSAVFQGDAAGAPTSFTVTASAPGLAPASATVQLSVDPADSVMQVAAASVALADLGRAD